MVANREHLDVMARDSLKIRMRRWLEVEQQLWKQSMTAIERAHYTEQSNQAPAVTAWTLYFTSGINLLSQPDSSTFKIDQVLVQEFAPVLAERIVQRYIASKAAYDNSGRDGYKDLHDFVNWAINLAANHWDKTTTDAVLNEVKLQVGKNDQLYASTLIGDFINNLGFEKVSPKETRQPGQRTENQEKIVGTLVDLLVGFSNNAAFVGKNGRSGFMNLLANISAEKRSGSPQAYRYITGNEPTKEEIAIIENLLNLLAGHAGVSEVNKASKGQTVAAEAIKKAITIEVGAELQAAMPSPLLKNILSSDEKLKKQRSFADKEKDKLSKAAAAELEAVKEATKGGKISLAKIQKLIGASLGSLGQGITAANQLKLNFDTSIKNKAEKMEIDVFAFLASWTQLYLTQNPAPEISPLAHALADFLRKKHHDEDLAKQPLEELRQKLAIVLKNSFEIPLTEAVAQEAELEAQKVLAQSMKWYFEATDSLVALETARLTKENIEQMERYFELVKLARREVTSPDSKTEKKLRTIKDNLKPVLGNATHLISMPDWDDIAGFIPDDLFSTAVTKAKDAIEN